MRLASVATLAQVVAFAWLSIFFEALSRLATCEARIDDVFLTLLCSVYSLNISSKSSNFACSSLDLVAEYALTSKSRALRTSF